MNDNTTPTDLFDLEYKDAVGGEPVPASITEEELPDKYKGKSAVEIARMHMNAEKRLSTMGNEIGSLRRQADQLLAIRPRENVSVPETPRKPVTVDEIFTDPEKAIRETLNTSDVARKADEAAKRADNIERQLALREFASRHPSYEQDLGDEAFQEWVAGNPARVELFRRADSYDVASADALWQMWGEYKQLNEIKEKRAAAVEKRKQALSAGRTISDASTDSPAKGPVYSRAKLMELQTRAHQGDSAARARWNDQTFQNELLRAYSEGRVR